MDIKNTGICLEQSDFDKIIFGKSAGRISKFYKFLLNLEMHEELIKPTMVKWAQDLDESLPLDQWGKNWSIRMKYKACVIIRENYLKMQYRWHLTPSKLSKIYKNQNPICWKCNKAIGSYVHMWWFCDLAKVYWKMIHQKVQIILQLSGNAASRHLTVADNRALAQWK